MTQVVSIQYLRAIAALVVVYSHVLLNRNGSDLHIYSFGGWGVDVFFVVSGFIMWVTTAQSKIGPVSFWGKRAARIYPIYWVALTVWIVSRLIVPDRLANADISTSTIIPSYLLIPHYHLTENHIWPILTPGWTLQFEIFFYLMFGSFLMIKTPFQRALCIISCLLSLSLLGVLLHPTNATLSTYTNPLLLEFGAGVILGIIYLRRFAVPPFVSILAIALGIGGLLSSKTYQFSDDARFLVHGLPAFFLVFGLTSFEEVIAKKPLRSLIALGDASYSLYLFHPIATGVVAVLWGKVVHATHPWLFVLIALFTSMATAVLVHRIVEEPLISFFRRKGLRSPRCAQADSQMPLQPQMGATIMAASRKTNVDCETTLFEASK